MFFVFGNRAQRDTNLIGQFCLRKAQMRAALSNLFTSRLQNRLLSQVWKVFESSIDKPFSDLLFCY